jgi:hypothetical protein
MARDLGRWVCTAGAAALTLMAVSAGTRVDFLHGNKLYQFCSPNSVGSVVCSVAGALMARRVTGRTACMPNGLAPDQMVSVARRFIEVHPAKRRSASSKLIAGCRRGPSATCAAS